MARKQVGTAPSGSTDAATKAYVDALVPAGCIQGYAVATPPSGWLLCDGSVVSRTTYATLFTAIGTTFGAGDGSTTFGLPDLRGRVLVGLDNMDNSVGTGGGDAGRLSAANTLGGSGGAETHTLTTGEIPSHDHTSPSHRHASSGDSFVTHVASGGTVNFTVGGGSPVTKQNNVNTDFTTPANVGNTGGGGAHNNMQPYMLLNWIIKI